MKAAFRTSLAAAGVAFAFLAAPAMAQVSMADQQHIVRTLTDMGYTNVTVLEDEGDVTVLATRNGVMQSFAYEPEYGELVSVGQNTANSRGNAVDFGYGEDRSGDNDRRADRMHHGGHGHGHGGMGHGGHNGGMGNGGDT